MDEDWEVGDKFVWELFQIEIKREQEFSSGVYHCELGGSSLYVSLSGWVDKFNLLTIIFFFIKMLVC